MLPNTSQLSAKKFLVALLAVVVAIGLLYGGIKLYNRSSGPYAYKYSGKMDFFKLDEQNGQDSISFNKPKELSSLTGQLNFQVVFTHFIPKVSPIIPIAHLEVAAVHTGGTLGATNKKFLGENLTNSSKSGYKSQVNYFHQFVEQRLGQDYQVTFQNVANFQNKWVTSNAWQASYTAEPKTSAKLKNLPVLKGKEILAAGDSTIYYLMLDAVNYNWQPNQNVWGQTLNSIKIDQ